MTKWDMTKKNLDSNGKIISTGQTVTPMYDNSDNDKLENKVNELEKKVDKLIDVLSNRQHELTREMKEK